MIGGTKMRNKLVRFAALFAVTIFLFGPSVTEALIYNPFMDFLTDEYGLYPQGIVPPLRSISEEVSTYYSSSDPGVDSKYLPSDYDISKFLMNNEMQYQSVWEPWLTKAAVRCIETDASKEFLAVGGGYLYDNEIHIYRWNGHTRNYDKVWDSGDQIIQGDVISIDFGDTDNNQFLEIVAGSADGHVYVFEQEHIYDPFDNMENQFVHVWTSPKIQQVWGVKIADVDKDYLPDIIAGSWDGKIHVYEYINHSGYPFSKQHWIEYAEKATINVGEKIYSIDVGDTNYNALPEIIAGTSLGRVYIYENNGTVLSINGKPWPLTQDNSYRYHWDSGNISWKPVTQMEVDSLDNDPHDEVVYIAQGQGVYVINWDPNVAGGCYLTHQLWEPFDSWELGGFEGLGHYLNHYIDWMTWSNNNLTRIPSGTYMPYNDTFYQEMTVFINGSMKPSGNFLPIENMSDLHVYWENDTTKIFITEPYARYVWEPQWPKNTSMAIHRKLDPWGEDGVYISDPPISHPPAENYTTFNARDSIASAIVDWGNDQEVMGDGLWAVPGTTLGYDVTLRFHDAYDPNLNKISFEISPDTQQWVRVPNENIKIQWKSGDDDVLLDIDPVLSSKHWAYFRYMRINVTDGGYYKIKGGYAPVMYRPMDTASSITIGSLDLDYYKAYTTGQSEGKKIVLGTVDGKIIMFRYNTATKAYDLLWNSYKNDSYTQGTNIWAITEVKSPGKIPTWLYNQSSSDIFNVNEELRQLEIDQSWLPGILGNYFSMDHVSLMKSFWENIFAVIEDYWPYAEIVDINVPANDIVVGTDNGKLVVFPSLVETWSVLGNYFFYPVNTNPFYNGMSISPTFVDFNQDPNHFPELMFLGWGDKDQLYDPIDPNKQQSMAGLDVYTFDLAASPIGAYVGRFELAEHEITGLLWRALEKSLVVPEVAWGDVDADGDSDLVLTNGRLYFIENIHNTMFRLDTEYFRDMNLKATDKLYNSPELYDFDGDGDLDLTVGYANREGATYFENKGSRWAPEWVENKWLYTNSWGGLWFNNLTTPTFAIDPATGVLTHLTTYNNHTGMMVKLLAEYENHNAFIIGTNPLISRLEINLKSGADSYGNLLANYGYHVFEVWNSQAELARWTLAIETGDMDQDGRQEVIVGSYDQNLYVFEHLTNNTYKRAYRSQDLTHKELSLTSPYAYEELEGVSGTFYRTIWDDVEEIVVGLDMDNDGFLEMVATAGLSIFIWEQNNDGFVSIDDEYTLIWQADLRQSAWAPLFADLGIDKFTAAAYAGDMDYNGFGEFVVAAGSFLFVFESSGSNNYYENFLKNPFPARGRYFTPGNPLVSPAVRALSIESIVVSDTDNDTLNEIIIGGLNKTWWGTYNGFVAILENQIGTYAYTWWAPNHLMDENPVYDLTVDNQDMDKYKEIIVGTFKGIVIYENNGTETERNNNYVERSILTSYVNFPTIKLKAMFDLETKVQLALRNTDMIELQRNVSTTLYYGNWIQVFKGGNRLYWATSADYGDTWTQRGPIVTLGVEIVTAGAGTWSWTYSNYEIHPSLFQAKDGRVWIAFSAKMTFNVFTYEGIWLLQLNPSSLTWENAVGIGTGSGNLAVQDFHGNYVYNPSVWEYNNNTAQRVAISYMNSSNGGIYWKGDFSAPNLRPEARIPNIGNSAFENNQTWNKLGYKAISHDAIRSVSGDVVLVFTGMSFKEAKVDYDLWIAKSNSTPMWDGAFPYSRATVDAIDELYPSITQTVTPDHTLMIIFEADGYAPSGALQITYSKDDGATWRDPEPVTTTPPFAEYISFPLYGFSLLVLKDYPFILVKSLISVGPAISAHWEGGFVYSFMAQYHLFSLAKISLTQTTTSTLTVGVGYAESVSPPDSTMTLNSGDITAHSGLVENIGGSITTGGGEVSYITTEGDTIPVGTLVNLTLGGGGSAIYYTTTVSTPTINYNTPIVTEDTQLSSYGGSIVAYGEDATGTDNPENDQNTGSYGLAAAVGFRGEDFHRDRQTPDRGFYNNIFFGMNPSSNFSLFDFKEARAIDTGDTDKDGRREIAIASGNQAFLVEVARTGGEEEVLFYYQPWHSDGLATETTDIELHDVNGNGMDELVVSCIEGNVYAFEGIFTEPSATDYLYFDWDPVWTNYEQGEFSSAPIQPDHLADTTDITLDGVDDIVFAMMDPDGIGYNGFPLIRAVNGATGSLIWEYNLSSTSISSKNSIVLNLRTIDLTGDGVKEVIALIHDITADNLYMIALEGTTGIERWPDDVFFFAIDATQYAEMMFEDIDNDTIPDVLTGIGDSIFFVSGVDGNYDGNNDARPEWFYTFPDHMDPDPTTHVTHISTTEDRVIVSGVDPDSGNGTVAIIDYNGTVIYTFLRNSSIYGLTATMLDITEDSIEDIIIFESGVMYVYDGTSNMTEALFNTSFDGSTGNAKETIKYDFNGDSYDDLLIQLHYNVTLTFEDQVSLTRVGESYIDQGINFSNTDPINIGTYLGWTAWDSGSSSIYTPHSGDITIFTRELDNYITIDDFATTVSAYFSTGSYSGFFVWEAYDIDGNLIDTTSFIPNRPVQYVELNDPYGRIYRVHVTGTGDTTWNSRFVMDSFSYWKNPEKVETKLVALSGINPEIYLWEYNLWDTYATEIKMGDLDHDSEDDDLLLLTEYTLDNPHTGAIFALDGTYGTPLGYMQLHGTGISVAAGNFGPYGEVAILNTSCTLSTWTFVHHEPTIALDLSIPEGSISYQTRGPVYAIDTGDFNNDDIEDVIFADKSRYLITLDGLTGEVIWKYRTSSPIQKVAIDDVDNDGYSDVAAALRSGMLVMINGQTGRPSWQHFMGLIIANQMQFVDYNHDSEKELAVSMGYRFSSIFGRIMLYNTTRDPVLGHGKVIWQFIQPFGPFTRFEVADFLNDANGILDFAVEIYEHSIWILNGNNGNPVNGILIKVHDFRVGIFTTNLHPQLAVIVRNGTVIIYDSLDYSSFGSIFEDKKIHLNIPFRLSHMATGNFDPSDQLHEIAIRSFANGTYCLDGDLSVLWTFEDRSIFYLPRYLTADLNDDGQLDIISFNIDNVIALSGTEREPTQVVWAAFIPKHLVLSAVIADFNNDGVDDIAVGTIDGMIYILHGTIERSFLQDTGPDGGTG
ncbi:MAG: hypothetical protein EAX86_10745 [Candidatus Heimdallarchaeota archaeon]|nr:hypothetical protein [Candidatus Heimdallarchaeota archaeon]